MCVLDQYFFAILKRGSSSRLFIFHTYYIMSYINTNINISMHLSIGLIMALFVMINWPYSWFLYSMLVMQPIFVEGCTHPGVLSWELRLYGWVLFSRLFELLIHGIMIKNALGYANYIIGIISCTITPLFLGLYSVIYLLLKDKEKVQEHLQNLDKSWFKVAVSAAD